MQSKIPGNFKQDTATEIKYDEMLIKLWEPCFREVRKMKDPKEQLAYLKAYVKTRAYRRALRSIPDYILRRLNSRNLKNWKSALYQAKGLETSTRIYAGLKKLRDTPIGRIRNEILEENAKYITGIPIDVAKQVAKFIDEESEKGRRAEDIAEDVAKLIPEKTRNKINLITRTQVSRARSALTEARSIYYGRNWYIWKTARDERVRTSHDVMEGVICSYSNPPSPEKLANKAGRYRMLKSGRKPWSYAGDYNPGGIYNCRCIAEVLITLEQVNWPHKVYYNGKIQTMTLKRFKEVSKWH